MKLKITAFAATTVMVFSVVMAPVAAQFEQISVTPSLRERVSEMVEQRRAELQEEVANRRETAIQNRCEMVNLRIDNAINRYDQNKARHVYRYNNVKQSVADLIVRLQAEGYDTQKLEEDFAILDEMVREFASTYTEFSGRMNDAKDISCDEDVESLRAKLQEGKGELAQVREKAREIQEFVNGTLIPDLREVKEQVRPDN